MKDYLIYTSAGLNANVHLWAKSKNKRNYDIWITNYSDTPGHLREYADYYNESKGAKYPNFKKVLSENMDILCKYKAIMLSDDDIIISHKKLNNLFRYFEERDLWIVAPSFSRFGKVSHDTTERKLTTRYRYTNFVETTCPIIRTDKLLDFMRVYDGEIKDYGVDWWYLNHFGKNVEDKIITSDENYCINPRDFRKSNGMREIDRISTEEGRRSLWEKKRSELGISSFRKMTYEEVRRGLMPTLFSAPGYFAEQIFWQMLDGNTLKPLRDGLKSTVRSLRKAGRMA